MVTGVRAPRRARFSTTYGGLVGDDDEDEIEQFQEQARWLIAYHDSRGESLSTRAVALLGFAGVILALMLRPNLPNGVDVDWWLAFTFVMAVGGLIATIACCLQTVKSRELQVPGAEQTRRQWRHYVQGSLRGRVAANVTETYLGGKDLNKTSTLDWAAHSANSRARWFQRAVAAMLFSLASLTVVLATVGWRAFY